MIKSFRIFLILFSLFSAKAYAQSALPIRGWKFVPQNEEQWAKYQEQIKAKNYYDVLELAQKIIKKNDSTSSQKAEAKYLQVLVLKEINYPSLSMDLLFGIIKDSPGTQVSYAALDQLNTLLQENFYNQDEFQNLFNRGSFKEVPESTISMISYFIALDNMKKKLVNWINEPLSQIDEKSYWYSQLQYFSAINLVKEKKLQAAEDMFEQIEKKDSTSEVIKRKAALQRARLLVTRQQYDEAEKLYSKYPFSGRLMGRVLFEEAYLRYRTKDYSTALGMLKSLKAPFFETAVNPNQYILSMMVFRDLCYYQAVKNNAAEFDKKFGKLIKHLKDGKEPKDSLILMRMALQDGHLKEYADLVDSVRKESARLATDEAIPKSVRSEYKATLAHVEERVQSKLRVPLQKKLDELSNEVIEVSEKIKLLDYISGLDQFRLKSTYENRDYKAATADNFSFDKLFWPVNDEYWTDEFSKYKVILTDRCEADSIKARTRK